MNLKNLYFGKDDAERDITSNGLLKAGFLKTSMYEMVRKGGKTLVIGRKGSGKSAICLMLHDNFCSSKNSFSCVITPDAISADEIRRFELVGVNDEQAKKLVWRYIFLVHIAKFLVELSDKHKVQIEDIDKIREFLVSNGELTELTFSEKFWKIINRIKASLTLSAFGQEVELSANDAPNEGIRIESKMEYVEKYLKGVLSKLKTHKLFLLVDKVDDIWNNDSWSDTMVISLLKAVKEINEAFPLVNCVVFLRQDIYELLNFHDRDKFRGDEIHLSWTDEKLKEMILARGNASMNSKLKGDKFWEEIFPKSINGEKSSNFIVDRTLKRPRDIIQFCNLCCDNANVANHSSVLVDDVIQAADVYSNWKLNDLLVEWKVNYPFLNDLLIIFSNASYVMPRRRFIKLYGHIKTAMENRYSDLTSILTIDSVLNILYAIGFIGIERNGNITYYYDNPRTVETKDKIFIVHPAFRNALKCESSTNIKDFEVEVESYRHYSEFYRGRALFRGAIEKARSPRRVIERLFSTVQKLRQPLLNENLPQDVSKEVVRNIDKILREIEKLEYEPSIVNFEITRLNCFKYFENLRIRLKESDLITEKSELDYELENSIRQIRKMRNMIDEDFY